MNISVFTDGGSRGNPGVSGYGIVIYDQDKKIIYQESKSLGIKTNNEAEYHALIGALNWLVSNQSGIDHVEFNSDSELMVRQQQGLYKVKSPTLSPLYQQTQQLFSKISIPYRFNHIRREYNQLADLLANQAMDQR